MENQNNVTPTIDEVEAAITQRVVSGVQSVSVDGMSTSYQSLDSQMKALSALSQYQAAKNPLGAIKLFKIKPGG